MPGATVRRAGSRDAAALSQLLQEYFSEGYVDQTETEESLSPQLQVSALGFYLTEVDGKLAGCVLCRPLTSRPESAECKRMFVRPEFRGRGLATLLMDTIEAEARKARLCVDVPR